MQVFGIRFIYHPDNIHRRPPFLPTISLAQHVQDLGFAVPSVADILLYLGPAVVDHGAVAWIRAARDFVLHFVQAGRVGCEVFEDGGALAKDVVAREHCGFFFEHQGHVVGRVARAVEGSERRALGLEDLVVMNVVLGVRGLVFVDGSVGVVG